MKKELVCKDEIIRTATEKYKKLNEEKETYRSINRGLNQTIEDLKGNCQDYQTIIKYNEEQIKQLREQINKQEQKPSERKISLNSLIEDEENEKEKDNIDNENKNEEKLEDKNLAKRNGVDYTGQEINLNELIFEESVSGEKEHEEAVEKKNQIKLAFTRVKHIRRFTKLKSLNYNNKKVHFADLAKKPSKKNVFFRGVTTKEELNINPINKRLKTIKSERIDFENSNLLQKLRNISRSHINQNKNDDKFLYELLFRFLDY